MSDKKPTRNWRPNIRPLWDEWWARGPIVAANEQHVKDLKLAFYVGFYCSLGLVAKSNRLRTDLAKRMIEECIEECKDEIMPGHTKVVASINGEQI